MVSVRGGQGRSGLQVVGCSAGKIQMLSPREQISGANMTNFAVCRITAPYVLTCCGWDEATMTQHPMGKLAIGGDCDRTGMVGTWFWGVCCATIHATVCGVCSLCSPGCLLDCACRDVGLLQALEELRGGEKTHSVFDSKVPCPMCEKTLLHISINMIPRHLLGSLGSPHLGA
jgi:hypothetical protein